MIYLFFLEFEYIGNAFMFLLYLHFFVNIDVSEKHQSDIEDSIADQLKTFQ